MIESEQKQINKKIAQTPRFVYIVGNTLLYIIIRLYDIQFRVVFGK